MQHTILANQLSHVLLMHPRSRITFTVRSVEKMSHFSLIGQMNFNDIFEGFGTLLETNDCASKRVGGVSWISRATRCQNMNLNFRREKILKGPLFVRDCEYPITEDLVQEECGCGPKSASAGESVITCTSTSVARHLRSDSEALISVCTSSWPHEH